MLDLDIVGDFLVMAASLLQIKSKMLLPPDPNVVNEDELDPREELARRLLEYKKFKQIAEELQIREIRRNDLFARNIDPEFAEALRDDAQEVLFEVNLFDLINALSDALKKVPEEIIHEIIKENYTVEQKIHDLLHLMLDHAHVMLGDVFSKCRSKIEAIVTFLALLELIRLKEISAVQKGLFGEIEIMRNKDNMLPVEQLPGVQEPPKNMTEMSDGRTEENRF